MHAKYLALLRVGNIGYLAIFSQKQRSSCKSHSKNSLYYNCAQFNALHFHGTVIFNEGSGGIRELLRRVSFFVWTPDWVYLS